MKIRD